MVTAAQFLSLCLSLPGVPFTPAQGAWGQHGWTYVALPDVKLPCLREVIGDAWRLVAPARLLRSASPASLDSDGASSGEEVRRKPSRALAKQSMRRSRSQQK